MRETLINYWLLRAAAASHPKDVYEYAGFATQTYEDDEISVLYIYRQLEAADRPNFKQSK